jgi:acetolactate synthase-1/3 small subunit
MRDLALIKVRASGTSRGELMQLASIFDAKIIDVAADAVIIEIAATEQKVNSLVELCVPFGIVEMVRTGRVAMARGGMNGNGNGNGNGHDVDEGQFE